MNLNASGNGHGPTILVTGACGYLGAQFIRALAQDPETNGTTIRLLDNMHRGLVSPLLGLPESGRYELVEGDILDPSACRRAMEDVSAVVHLAALVRTPFSYDHPEWTRHVNQWGTAALVDAAVDAGVQRFVYASSSSVYGPGGPFQEADTCRPVGPYSMSKFEGEKAVLAGRQRGLEATVLRIATVYGGTGSAVRFDALPNRLAFLAGTGQTVRIASPASQLWPYVHVADASRALVETTLGRLSADGDVLNVAEANYQTDHLADIVAEMAPAAEIRFSQADPHTHFSSTVETDAMRRRGWQPARNMREGIQELLGQFVHFQSTTGALVAPSE